MRCVGIFLGRLGPGRIISVVAVAVLLSAVSVLEKAACVTSDHAEPRRGQTQPGRFVGGVAGLFGHPLALTRIPAIFVYEIHGLSVLDPRAPTANAKARRKVPVGKFESKR